MKSIKQQYIDLTEGRMSQNNFMRSMRRSLPQYITNVTSLKDTVKILRNKGIISEIVDNSEGEYENLVNTILKYVKDPDEARQYADSNPQQWPDWLKANMDIDSEMGLNENGDYNAIIPALKAKGITSSMSEKEIIGAIAEVMKELGYTNNQILNLVNRDEDFLPDLLQDLKNDNKQDMPGFEGTLDALNNLYEAKEVGVGYYNQDGKELYAPFSEINKLNGQEVFTGIGIEHEAYPEKSYAEIEKIVIKNLKKNQFYYTDYKLSGVAGAEPKIEGSVKPEDRQMKSVKDGNVIDKAMGMKPVKGFANAKASANKAHKETVKGEKVDIMSLVAQTVRGLVKMNPTGEKGKKIAMKEARLNLAPGEKPNAAVAQALQFIEGNNELKAISDKISLQNSHQDAVLRYGYWEQLQPALVNKLGLQFKVNEDYEFDDERGSLYAYILTPKSSMTAKTPGEAVAKALTKEDIAAMVREVMDETMDGRDNLVDPIAAEEYSMNEEELTPQEKKIADDILNNLNEGFDSFLDKIKLYAKKGLMTAAILGSLLASSQFTQAQQNQIKQTAGIEATMQKGGGIEKMSNQDAYNYVYNMIKKNTDGVIKQLKNYKASNQEDKVDVVMLLTFANSVKEGNPIKGADYMGKRFKMASNIINNLNTNSTAKFAEFY